MYCTLGISFIFGLIVLIQNASTADPTVWGKFSGVVSITTSSLNVGCVGHIVDNRHVVTAAQCVLDKEREKVKNVFWFRVIAGDIKLYEPTQYRVERNVTNIFIHELYNSQTNENDVVVLRLDVPFIFPHNTIEPVVQNSKIIQSSTSCDFVGWNVDKEGQSEQQSTTMLIYDRDFCNSQQYPGLIFESVMCGQMQRADALPKNNIGGGLYCNSELTGLLSIPQTETSIPSVFTQIRFYQKWIQKQILKLDRPDKRISPITLNIH